ncbi:hypothetical protein PR048_001068 [Dryococelus australis]|uniref:HAT C-terminal dimerisation domain-containing protein n=1 Tax=Dryococelus australis TaxID=614101 RepID=A0ABQ9IGD1_9NEOP|nr:hypothetical protein PR048_001068 [Dryococelus australis]
MSFPLKYYFQSRKKCPNVIKKFSENPLSETLSTIRLLIFHDDLKGTECQKVTLFEVRDIIINRKPIKEGIVLDIITFRQDTAVQYLTKWNTYFEDIHIEDLYRVTLQGMPVWEKVDKTLDFVKNTVPSFQIDKNCLYNEFLYLKQYNTEISLLERRRIKFVLCQPGTNAATERVFSPMLVTKVNFRCSCVELFKMLRENRNFL